MGVLYKSVHHHQYCIAHHHHNNPSGTYCVAPTEKTGNSCSGKYVVVVSGGAVQWPVSDLTCRSLVIKGHGSLIRL